MLLPEMVYWLETDGINTRGTNLFYGITPDTPDALICLHEYSGLSNEVTMGSTTINLEIPYFQAEIRGVARDYDGPRLKALQLVNSLTKIGETTILGVKYHAVMALQPPFMVSPDANFRNTFKVNFRVWKDPSTS